VGKKEGIGFGMLSKYRGGGGKGSLFSLHRERGGVRTNGSCMESRRKGKD